MFCFKCQHHLRAFACCRVGAVRNVCWLALSLACFALSCFPTCGPKSSTDCTHRYVVPKDCMRDCIIMMALQLWANRMYHIWKRNLSHSMWVSCACVSSASKWPAASSICASRCLRVAAPFCNLTWERWQQLGSSFFANPWGLHGAVCQLVITTAEGWHESDVAIGIWVWQWSIAFGKPRTMIVLHIQGTSLDLDDLRNAFEVSGMSDVVAHVPSSSWAKRSHCCHWMCSKYAMQGLARHSQQDVKLLLHDDLSALSTVLGEKSSCGGRTLWSRCSTVWCAWSDRVWEISCTRTESYCTAISTFVHAHSTHSRHILPR